MAKASLLVINPNSSEVITDALRRSLSAPPDTELHFMTGPSDAPPSINDPPTSIQSAHTTFRALQPLEEKPYDGYLICCFSDHPLVPCIRHVLPSKPCIGIFDSAILHALATSTRFGILTSGSDMVPGIDAGVLSYLGGPSARYVGCIASGLGVVELQTGDRVKVEARMKESAAEVYRKGADVIVLGCAGMSGMEELVRQGVVEAGGKLVKVVDGARAGVEILAGLARLRY